MKTLDELLSEKAQLQFQDKLISIIDPATWTSENKDEKLADMRQISQDVAAQAVNYVKEMLELEIDGRSLIEWKIYEQFIGAELQLLMAHRDELDADTEYNLTSYPYDYTWLISAIRSRVQELAQIETSLETQLRPEGTAEEI